MTLLRCWGWLLRAVAIPLQSGLERPRLARSGLSDPARLRQARRQALRGAVAGSECRAGRTFASDLSWPPPSLALRILEGNVSNAAAAARRVPMTSEEIEDEEKWLRRRVVRLRPVMRFALDRGVQTLLKEFITEAEERLEKLGQLRKSPTRACLVVQRGAMS